MQRAQRRRRGALRAGGPLAEPAIDADRRRLDRVEIEALGVDEAVAYLISQPRPMRIMRLDRALGRDRAAHGPRDREPLRASVSSITCVKIWPGSAKAA